MAHSSDLDSSDAFMSEKEAGYSGGSESSHSNLLISSNESKSLWRNYPGGGGGEEGSGL